MKLNPDCIRDILLSIEELSTHDSLLTSEQISQTKFLTKYSNDEVLYHLNQLYLAGYIIAPKNHRLIDETFLVNDLSPIGHEFISDIRKDTNWNKVKKISKEIGSETLQSLKSIAEGVIASAIKASLGLP